VIKPLDISPRNHYINLINNWRLDMTPRNYPLEDLITEEELAAELDAEMREWDERNGITYEDGEEYEYSEPDDSWMDGDALASAGWGTDEDYGYYGEEAY
jgi:hypothetical protein